MPTVNLGRVKPIHRGAYNGATTYQPLDYLTYNGVEYHCIVTSTGNLPTDTGFFSPVVDVSTKLDVLNPSYTGTLTGGTGVVNLGSGQFYKDAAGNVGVGTVSPSASIQTGDGTQTIREVRTSTLGGVSQGGFLRGYRAGSPSYYVGDSAPITGLADGGLSVYSYGATPLDFYTDGSKRVTIQADGRLQIGTTSGSTDKTYIYTNSTGAGLNIRQDGAGPVQTWSGTGGAQLATITSAGNLGLGVTPSAWGGSGTKALQLGVRGSLYSFVGTTTDVGNNVYFNGTDYKLLDTAAATFYRQFAGTHSWHYAASAAAGSTVSMPALMTLNTAGNLGLGVTPSAWASPFASGVFETSAGYIASSSSDNVLRIGSNHFYDGAYKYKTSNYATAYTQSSGAHVWYTAPSGTAGNPISFTQAMTLDASGNLYVAGVMSYGGGSNSDTNSFIGADSRYPAIGVAWASPRILQNHVGLGFSTHPNYGGTRFFDQGYPDVTTSTEIARFQSGALRFPSGSTVRGGAAGELIFGAGSGGLYQQIGGNYYQVNTTGGSTSDAALKKNVVQLESSLQKIQALRGVKFEYIEDQKAISEQGIQIGVIAQEVEAQFPEIVITNENGIKAVRYEKLIAPLIEAIKEQQAQIESLTTRISQLENN